MKHLTIYLAFSFCLLLLPAPVHAAIPTATPSASSKSVDKEINDLKDRIASKVAELRLVERRGISGKTTEVTNSQITLMDGLGNTRFIDVDELTKFSSPSAKETFGISDITKGTTLGVLGLYNKQSQRLLARFVNVLIAPRVLHGAVESVNSANFTFRLVTSENNQQTVDVEKVTKTMSFSQDTGVVKAGFSKIKVGERVMVVGYVDAKNPTLISATRIILFPDIPKNPKIKLSEEIPPTTVQPQLTSTPSPTSKVK